jgi:hypothetical protein
MQETKKNKNTRFFKRTLKKKSFYKGGAIIRDSINALNSANQRADRGISKVNNATEKLNNAVEGLDNMKNNVKNLLQSLKTQAVSSPIVPKEGIVEIAGESAVDAAEESAAFVGKKLLRLFGLQPVDSDEAPQDKDAASKISSVLFNTIDDKFGCIIKKLNDFLGSEETRATIAESSKNLVDIFTTLLKDFNATLDDPILKEEFVVTVYILGEYTKIFADSMDEPLDEAIDLLNQAAVKALGGVSASAVKILADFAGAIPYAGAFFDLGRAVNDGSKGALSLFNAGVNSVEASSLLFGKTSQQINQAFEDVKAKQAEAGNIMQRANESIQKFVNNPLKNAATNAENVAANTENNINKIKRMSVTGGSRRRKKVNNKNNNNKTKYRHRNKMQ